MPRSGRAAATGMAGPFHRPGQRKRKLAEERTRETTLKTDGRVNGREGERHGDHRSDEFACTEECGVELRIAMRLLSGFDGDALLSPSAELVRPQSLLANRMGLWFAPPGAPEVSLRTRTTLAVLLRRLGEQRTTSPGRAPPWSSSATPTPTNCALCSCR